MTPAIEKAKQVGTYNQADRSRQYNEADPRAMLRAVNEAWTKIRNCEKELTKKDADIAELRADKAHLWKLLFLAMTATSGMTVFLLKMIELVLQ